MLVFFCKTQRNKYRAIDLSHFAFFKAGYLFAETALVECSNLFEQGDGILWQVIFFARDFDMGGQFGFSEFACYGRNYDSWGVAIADVVLNYQNRSHATLFAAYHRAQISHINFTAFYALILHNSLSKNHTSRLFPKPPAL